MSFGISNAKKLDDMPSNQIENISSIHENGGEISATEEQVDEVVKIIALHPGYGRELKMMLVKAPSIEEAIFAMRSFLRLGSESIEPNSGLESQIFKLTNLNLIRNEVKSLIIHQ